MPVKGVAGFDRSAPVSGPTYVEATAGGRKIRRGVKLWTVTVATFKSETYRFLRLERPTDEELAEGEPYPAGYVHIPRWVDSEWIKQFTAEQLVTVRTRRGYSKLEWQKTRERNEALDCRVYARAAAWLLGLDRWSQRKWRNLESEVGIETTEPDVDAAATSNPRTKETGAPQTEIPRRNDWVLRNDDWLGSRRRTWNRR